jgi:hypothetical protein
MIIHHTGTYFNLLCCLSHRNNYMPTNLDCSASIVKNNDVRQALKERVPGQSVEIDKLVFLLRIEFPRSRPE